MTARRGRLAAAIAATAALAALVGGCSNDPSPTPGNAAQTTESTSAAAPTPDGGGSNSASGVTDAQAVQLCSDMESQLQNWRTYPPTLGKSGLNTVVISWATANGVDLLALAGDRERVDTITSAQCPQVRQGALDALEIPTLASALIGF
ncbi:hypothetical protein [Rhodococcus spongiicola]|uniref:Lipoprotein n=1 Tax=Rhodococcus spongiicola TaxID=2487352 RepID=A0A438B1S1_9NOCA|nr:hypothetical protein [Rhodococcus spongiicola]RVW04919.1 hypothetical protein EF834_08050 [Rhodococcus spongiicola]